MSDFTSLEDQIRECFGRVVYSHKTHEKMADDCAKVLRRYKLAQIWVSALTASGAIASLLQGSLYAKWIIAILSILGVGLTSYMKGFDPGGSAQKHRDAASALWPIRESYLSLLTDLRMKSIGVEEAVKRRNALQTELAAIYKGSPQTNAKAYDAAQKALKDNEEFTFSDAEIDCFLPYSLRKTGLSAHSHTNRRETDF